MQLKVRRLVGVLRRLVGVRVTLDDEALSLILPSAPQLNFIFLQVVCNNDYGYYK